MAESEWTIYLDSVESGCIEVEGIIYSSDSSTLQDFLLMLQANRTACERIIWATLESHVDATISENVRVNVKRLSNAIQTLVDKVERQLFSVDSMAYSSSLFSEILVNRSRFVGRPKLIINLTQIEHLETGSLPGPEFATHYAFHTQLYGED